LPVVFGSWAKTGLASTAREAASNAIFFMESFSFIAELLLYNARREQTFRNISGNHWWDANDR
jgi:hypothetical protein